MSTYMRAIHSFCSILSCISKPNLLSVLTSGLSQSHTCTCALIDPPPSLLCLLFCLTYSACKCPVGKLQPTVKGCQTTPHRHAPAGLAAGWPTQHAAAGVRLPTRAVRRQPRCAGMHPGKLHAATPGRAALELRFGEAARRCWAGPGCVLQAATPAAAPYCAHAAAGCRCRQLEAAKLCTPAAAGCRPAAPSAAGSRWGRRGQQTCRQAEYEMTNMNEPLQMQAAHQRAGGGKAAAPQAKQCSAPNSPPP